MVTHKGSSFGMQAALGVLITFHNTNQVLIKIKIAQDLSLRSWKGLKILFKKYRLSRSRVDDCLHTEGVVYFPCFVPKLLMNGRTGVYF